MLYVFCHAAIHSISVMILLNYMNCQFCSDYSSQTAYQLMLSNDRCTCGMYAILSLYYYRIVWKHYLENVCHIYCSEQLKHLNLSGVLFCHLGSDTAHLLPCLWYGVSRIKYLVNCCDPDKLLAHLFGFEPMFPNEYYLTNK